MKEILLSKKEFAERRGPFRFDINLLDVNLAQIQFGLLKRVKVEFLEPTNENTISETYESSNPITDLSTVMVECLRRNTHSSPYEIWLTVYDSKKERMRKIRLANGDEKLIISFLDSNSFLPICKNEVLYIDYEFRNLKSIEDYIEQLIAKIVRRTETDVPDYGDFMPVSETFVNPYVCDRRIVGRYGLEIIKMPYDVEPEPKKRFLRANAYEPSGQYKSGMIVKSGTKDEILETLLSETFPTELFIIFDNLRDSLRDL